MSDQTMVDWRQLPVDEAIVRRINAGPINGDPADWQARGEFKRAFLHLLEQRCMNVEPYPRDRFSGRGIVIATSARAGWSSGKNLPQGFLPGSWVTVNELRRLGCTLPITLAYLGFEEFDESLRQLFEPLGCEIMDLRWLDWWSDPMRILAGWETKVYAIEHAPYERVLFIDADNVPVRDPSYLFDYPAMQQTGAMFWPDLPPGGNRSEWVSPVVWQSVGMEYRPYRDFESGQLLVNKKQSWHALKVARFLNEHSDYWYSMIFGDKTTYFLAWNKLGQPYAMPERAAGWRCKAILQFDLNGQPLFEHACQDKPTLNGYSADGYFTHEAAIHQHIRDLADRWDGHLWHLARGDADTSVAGLYTYTRHGLGARPLELLPEGAIGLGRERCETQWRSFDTPTRGTVVVLYSDTDMPVAVLAEHDGVYWGQWLHYEKCRCSLELV